MIFVFLLIFTIKVSGNFELSNLTLPEGMRVHFAAVYDDVFTVLAGYNGYEYTTSSRSTLIYPNLNSNGQWSLNPLPFAISEIFTYTDSGITINGEKYITNPWNIGGIIIFNLISNEYTFSDSPPYGAFTAYHDIFIDNVVKFGDDWYWPLLFRLFVLMLF